MKIMNALNKLLGGIGKPALLLAAFALTGTLLLAGMQTLTSGQIAENARQALLSKINMLVDPTRYDNDPLQDSLTLPAAVLHSAEPVTVYRLRKQGQPVAAVLITTSPEGYSGNISLVVGVNSDQSLAGVRVLAHKETPGLGDLIEVDKHDWILGFTGKSLQNPAPSGWAVRKDGGEFDQFTGATITPRAVVGAVKRVLEWVQYNPNQLFAPASQ